MVPVSQLLLASVVSALASETVEAPTDIAGPRGVSPIVSDHPPLARRLLPEPQNLRERGPAVVTQEPLRGPRSV